MTTSFSHSFVATCCALGALCCIALPALAERADRDKPTHVEADRIDIDDANKVQVLTGNVVVTRGTMRLLAEKVVITQDAQGFQKAIATAGNGLAKFRQKREGVNEYIDGEALRIEYDGQQDKAELFGRAWVKSGQDEVRGEYVVYDGNTDKYLATGAPAPSEVAGATKSTTPASTRARAIIQPRNNTAAPAAGKTTTKADAPAVTLTPTKTLNAP